MNENQAFWITNDYYDENKKLKAHLAQKKYVAHIKNQFGDAQCFFFDEVIDLDLACIAYVLKIIKIHKTSLL